MRLVYEMSAYVKDAQRRTDEWLFARHWYYQDYEGAGVTMLIVESKSGKKRFLYRLKTASDDNVTILEMWRQCWLAEGFVVPAKFHAGKVDYYVTADYTSK